MTPEDLRAAVAAGLISEAQAAGLTALSQSRAGRRTAMPAEDEPFEFFRGFSEIFISIGLIILLAGIAGVLTWFGGFALRTMVPLATAGIAWWWAGYFTLKRRMNLPSMVLATAYGAGVFLTVATLLGRTDSVRVIAVLAFTLAALAMALWYRRFRLPFSAFVLGLFALGAIYSATGSLESLGAFAIGRSGSRNLFDLRESPAFATATLMFGMGAFAVGLWFDSRDPHRLGRYAATAFWCHLLAAPALVNTVAMTLLNTGGSSGIALLSIALLGITLLALVIDRRSFLTAAIAYIAIVIAWVAGDSSDFGRWAFVLIALGGVITAIGTWWIPLRAIVMRTLPSFPGKASLPPWS